MAGSQAGGQTLAAIGAQITAMLVARQPDAGHTALAYLATPVPVPADLVQDGVVNPARMSLFLSMNFNTPCLLADGSSAGCVPDGYYGTFSQIYATAAGLASPAGSLDDAQAQVVASLIAQARSALPATDLAVQMVAGPDDWVLPSGATAWTTFTSSASTPAPPAPQTGGSGPPDIWSIRPVLRLPPAAIVQGLHPAPGPAVNAAEAPRMSFRPMPRMAMQVTDGPVSSVASMMLPRPILLTPILPHPVLPHPIDPLPRPLPRPLPPPVASPTSSVSISFDYMMVTTDYQSAGASVVNNVFIANDGWIIAGMDRGALLPDPAQSDPAHAGFAYGVVTRLVAVRNVAISIRWSEADRAALADSPDGICIGPFPVLGNPAATASDGTQTYLMPAMTVIAVACRRLPPLPPRDAVEATPATPASPQPSPAGVPA